MNIKGRSDCRRPRAATVAGSIGNQSPLAKDLEKNRISRGKLMATHQTKAQKETVTRVMHMKVRDGQGVTRQDRTERARDRQKNPRSALCGSLAARHSRTFEDDQEGAPTRPGLSRVGAGEPVARRIFYDPAIPKGVFCTEICLALILAKCRWVGSSRWISNKARLS